LYVELATRVASQPFDRTTGSVRAVLESMHAVFTLTRPILRDAGPDMAPHAKAFGPLAIGFLTEVLAPFLLKWHEPLRAHEATRPPEMPVVVRQRQWPRHAELTQDIQQLQATTLGYVAALAVIAGVGRAS
jgi:hypothetical protein